MRGSRWPNAIETRKQPPETSYRRESDFSWESNEPRKNATAFEKREIAHQTMSHDCRARGIAGDDVNSEKVELLSHNANLVWKDG
jgi:hypothetical protein